MTTEVTTSRTHLMTDVGPTIQTTLNLTSLGFIATIAPSGDQVSSTILSGGYKNFAFGITSSQAGSVSIQRYLDQGATVPQGSPVTGTLVAATALTVNSNDGAPFQSLIITITNSSGSTTANLTNVLLLFQSQ